MKRTLIILSVLIICLVFFNKVEGKTLVKYHKNTGDIIQTNNVEEMPSQEILADRFKSETTDVLLVDSAVDISTQRVDLNKKKLIAIPQKELDDAKRIRDEKAAEEKLIKEEIRRQAIDKLKADGVVFKRIDQ